jgi:hypothetical protein
MRAVMRDCFAREERKGLYLIKAVERFSRIVEKVIFDIIAFVSECASVVRIKGNKGIVARCKEG